MYSVLFSKEAKNVIAKLNSKTRQQIKTAITELSANPEIGKRLTHELKGLWSYRSGNYRIIYEINRSEIFVIVFTIGHRKQIYQKTKRKYK